MSSGITQVARFWFRNTFSRRWSSYLALVLLIGAIGGIATHSLGGAIIGAGIGALAGAVLVENQHNGWCTYKYHQKMYRDHCRY